MTTGPTSSQSDRTTHSTPHFDVVLYEGLSWSQVGPSLEPLETEYARITEDLQVPDPSRIRVEVWASRAAFEAAMQQSLGVPACAALAFLSRPGQLPHAHRAQHPVQRRQANDL